MNDEDLQRLTSILLEQLKALAEQRIDDMQLLEAEKTELLQTLKDVQVLSVPQRGQLETILTQQRYLESLCVEIRDELGDRLKAQLQKNKAVKAYEQGGF
ncbi:hypothetical protein [Nitrincola sp.]|uniref:hypothetical protein n=1 Tax=Nitrincola sp. TaxID=1926584 RepID=UPI003A93B928